MIKISANLSKKVPMPNVDYSSQQFGAALEIEVADADQPEVLKARLKRLYDLLTQAVNEQIADAVASKANGSPPPAAGAGNSASARRWSKPTANPTGNGGNGNGHKPAATAAQQKAIFAICKAGNLDMKAVLAELGVKDAADLSVRDASLLIDKLKSARRQ